MSTGPDNWQEQLAIIDRTMRRISGITDPEELVDVYWEGVGGLLPIDDFISVSRRDVDPPGYLITRSSRFTEHLNPWTQRNRLPRCVGGVMGEVAYADHPVIMTDLARRLREDDPAYPYLHGFDLMVALPNYDGGKGLNVTGLLFPPGAAFDFSQLPNIHWHTSLLGRSTQNLVLRNRLTEALSRLDRELQVVGSIQRSLLPRELPGIPGVELAALYETSARAGGDYYDFFPLADGCWGVFIADVSGHGTPAAVLMAITHAIAHAQPGTHTPPSELLTYLNRALTRSYTGGGTFVTAFYGVLDPRTRRLSYCNAGHPPPRLVREDSVAAVDGTAGLPLGIVDDEVYPEASLELRGGDLLLLYTDGVTESMSPVDGEGRRELFGFEQLDRVLRDCRRHGPGACLDRVRRAVDQFAGNSPVTDDQTLICLRVAD